MPDTRWRKAWRDAWLHKARTVLVVVAIAVALAGAGTVLNAWALVRRATQGGFLASNPVAATLRTDSVDAGLLRQVRAVAGIRDAEGRRAVSASVQVQGAWRPALLFAYDDLARVRIGVLKPEAGTWPPASGTIAIERSSVEYAATGVGDSVSITTAPGQVRSTGVSGIVRDVSLAPGWMEHVVYGFVTTETLAQLGMPSTLTEVRLVVADPGASQAEVRRIAFRAKAVVEATGRRVRDVEVPEPGEHIHAPQMDSLLMTQGAFGLLALFTCAFLVVNLVAAMLAGQAREIGIMKTLGASPGQLARLYLAHAAALGVLASAIAIPVAWKAGRAYAAVKADLLNFDVAGVAMPLWAVALQLLVGVLVPVLAAAVPVRRAARMPVAAALRDVGIAHEGRAAAEPLLARRGGMSRVTLLSIRNAFRRRQRMVLTMLALAGGGAVYLGAGNLRQSVIGSVDLMYRSQRQDFVLRLGEPQSAARAESLLRGVAGIEAVEGWTGARATRALGDGTSGNTFGITALPPGSRLFAPEVMTGRWLAAGDTNALVVTRTLLTREPDLRLGVPTEFVVGGHRGTWVIVGTIDGGPTPTAYTSTAALARATGEPGVSSLVVATGLSGLATQVDLIQRARAALGVAGMAVASSQLLSESRRVTEDHLLMVVDFLAAMGWLMVAVGGMGLASTMGLAVLERTREIGVMRAIGARHRAILLMIELEGLVVAVLAWAVALPLSVPMSAALGVAFGRVMFRVPLILLPAWGGVLAWLGLVTVVSLAACAWPAIRATRGTIAAALAYE